MTIERINLHTIHAMPQDDVVTVIRQRWFRVDVGHRSIGARFHWVSGLAALIAIETSYVEPFVHLPTFTANAAETAAFPRLADRADKKLFVISRLEQSVIGGWQ